MLDVMCNKTVVRNNVKSLCIVVIPGIISPPFIMLMEANEIQIAALLYCFMLVIFGCLFIKPTKASPLFSVAGLAALQFVSLASLLTSSGYNSFYANYLNPLINEYLGTAVAFSFLDSFGGLPFWGVTTLLTPTLLVVGAMIRKHCFSQR